MNFKNMKQDGNETTSFKVIIQESKKNILWILGGVLFVIIGIVVLNFAVKSIQTFIKEHSYPSTTALVESHEIVKGVDKYSFSYTIYGEYYYHDKVVGLPKNLDEGSEFQIRYNPDNPDEYTFNLGKFPWVSLVLGLLFLLVGVFIVFRNITFLKKKIKWDMQDEDDSSGVDSFLSEEEFSHIEVLSEDNSSHR